MSAQDARPTLLIFTLGPKAETRRHRMVPEPWQAAEVELRFSCLQRVLAAGLQTGFWIEISSPTPLDEAAAEELGIGVVQRQQPRGSFGARLDGALKGCFARNPGPVVVVGTDVPGLAAEHLETAVKRLGDDPDRVVIGPSPDGGLYLLAAHRPIEGLGRSVDWCCAKTLRTLLDFLTASGRTVVLLDPLIDLDRPSDLERWLATAPTDVGWQPILITLLRLLAHLRRPGPDRRLPTLCHGFAITIPVRGPPALSAVC